ncbi:MAG: lipoprotein-releasing system ATP-binding protein [Phycisphaerales bacterium]|nr:lipoprotein-releasing system ATP-binding protein [Phycisphaerales bacterium]MEA2735238.1 lipoprotein-releasing system ATP-binding protein [Humisphaera sp.]
MSQVTQQPIVPSQNTTPILRAKSVSKTYRMGDSTLQVLKSVDLSVKTGEFLAIEGRSGSGKSTLLHLLGALDGADGGSIEYNGQDIARIPAAERSRLRNQQFGFVFQFYHLLPELNVIENTLLGPMIEFSWWAWRQKRATYRERAADILKQLGMDHRMRHRPNQLSGGERQRVAIARALMNQPKVLFADEPTGNLDAETGRQIMTVLEGLHRERGQTIVMVTHDRQIAHRADRVLVLKDGRLANAEKGD